MNWLGVIPSQVWDWQLANFPKVVDNPHWPVMGICEEAGELIHAILKEQQCVRGTPEKWLAKKRDAVGDIAIFTISACYVLKWNVDEVFADTQREHMTPAKEALSIFACSGAAADYMVRDGPWQARSAVRHVIIHARRYCLAMGWTFDEVVTNTWKEVQQRNWVKDPIGGGAA